MNNILTVIKFTYRNRIKSKAFLVSSVLLALIITVAINLPYVISRLSSHQPVKIGIVQMQVPTGQTQSSSQLQTNEAMVEIPNLLQKYFAAQSHPGVAMVVLPGGGTSSADSAILNHALQAKQIQAYLELQSGPASSFPNITYKTSQSVMSDSNVTSELQMALQSIKTQMVVKQLGLTPQQLKDLYTPVTITSQHISAAGAAAKGQSNAMVVMASVLVYGLLMVLFMSVTMSGSMIANEVTAEKSSRVMEILISSVSPLQQMFGKIIGIALVSLSQIAAFVVVAIVNANLPQNTHYLQQYHLRLSDIPISLLIYFVVFYLLGYFMYATLFAAIGSLVSRTEDLAQAVMPVTFLLLGGFYLALYGLRVPNSALIVGLSFFPFFTPLIMFLRVGLGNPATWQVVLSIVVLLASVYGMTWLAAKIYRTGVLMYGKRPSWRELRKAMKAMKV